MKTKLIRPFVFLFALASCDSISKTVRESYRYELYIDFQNVSYQGQNSTQRLYFEVDSTKASWYHGKLVINNSDTFIIQGFEKGNRYVTTYKVPRNGRHGGLDIWTRGEIGEIRDSLTIWDPDPGSGIVKEKTVLHRQPRKVCH